MKHIFFSRLALNAALCLVFGAGTVRSAQKLDSLANINQNIAQTIAQNITTVATGFNFPEGPAFNGRSGKAARLMVSNCYGDYIAQFGVDGKPVSGLDTAFISRPNGLAPNLLMKPNGLAYYKDGSLFVCDFGRKAILRLYPDNPAKPQEIYAEGSSTAPLLGPNDLAFDPNGNLYFTDPRGSGLNKLIGGVYLVRGAPETANPAANQTTKRELVKVADSLAFPNGIALSGDAKFLFVAESRRFHILRYRINADGTLSDRTVFAKMPSDHDPDGIALDSAGNLWVAQFGAGAVQVFAPSGTLLRSVAMPGKNITNLEFAGDDLKTLFVTDADKNALHVLRVETAGQRLFSSPRK
jgi:gluconolactonase